MKDASGLVSSFVIRHSSFKHFLSRHSPPIGLRRHVGRIDEGFEARQAEPGEMHGGALLGRQLVATPFSASFRSKIALKVSKLASPSSFSPSTTKVGVALTL